MEIKSLIRPIYVYDSRAQFEIPLFVVYDRNLIQPILEVAFKDSVGHEYISSVKMHPYEAADYPKSIKSKNYY